MHVVAWVRYRDSVLDPKRLGGRTGRTHPDDRSELLKLLEELFHARIDVQCGDGTHCLLAYVTGYVSKASDVLSFQTKECRAAFKIYVVVCSGQKF